jgi:hypothetical protein
MVDFQDKGSGTGPMYSTRGVQTPAHGPTALLDWSPHTYYNTFIYYYHAETAWLTIVSVTSVRLYYQLGTDYLYEIHIRHWRDG